MNSRQAIVFTLTLPRLATITAPPSSHRETASKGSGGTRLAQTTKDTMFGVATRLLTRLAAAQLSPAISTIITAIGLVLVSCSDPMMPMPTKASRMPAMWRPEILSANSIKLNPAVKKAWLWMTTEASPAEMPTAMAKNSRPNWISPKKMPNRTMFCQLVSGRGRKKMAGNTTSANLMPARRNGGMPSRPQSTTTKLNPQMAVTRITARMSAGRIIQGFAADRIMRRGRP